MAKKKNKRVVKIQKNSKKGIEMSFEWIFAMLIGGIILFIAIYAVVHLLTTGHQVTNTQAADELMGYLNTYETGQGTGINDQINFASESRLLFEECEPNDNKPFGSQSFAFSDKMFGKYGTPGTPIPVYSKYIFANDSVEGKNFYIVSIPYFMGYKVSDLIMIYSGKYCFISAPQEIQDDIENLRLNNINFSENKNCSGIRVCFDNNVKDCDIKVSGLCSGCQSEYEFGTVEKYDKDGKLLSTNYYSGNLMYGAIFSSNAIYECNVKRLMSKFSELGNVYLGKIKIMEIKGCSSNIQLVLAQATQSANSLQDSKGLIGLDSQVEDINKINEAASEGCKLFVNE